jgi:hypothetical protein
MTHLLLNGIGPVELDQENRTLTPVNLQVAVKLWWMIQHNPRKAYQYMEECEQVACDYTEDDLGWFWDLPVPPNYHLCPCCSC